MIAFLALASSYLKSGRVSGIRLSTRPDCVDEEILDILSFYGVSAVELGVQSLDEEVLKASGRRHSVKDTADACAKHEQIIKSLGGIDLQLLGLGNNGHIGFNEPGAAFEKETHLVDLAESTIRANARFLPLLTKCPSRHILWE